MAEKIIILSYFYLNKLNYILAILFLIVLIYIVLYLWLLLVQLKHNDYCTPLMMFIFGEKACNKTIYKTASEEVQQKLAGLYGDIKKNANELEQHHATKYVAAMQQKMQKISTELEFQNMFLEKATILEQIKNAIRKMNEAYTKNVENYEQVITTYNNNLKGFLSNLGNVLDKLRMQINVAYVTPALYKLIDPLLKLYASIAETLHQPTTPQLKINAKTNLSATIEQSKKILNITP